MGFIEARGVSKSYPPGEGLVLDSVNLDLERGCFSTFIGPNGSGKTTLLHIVSGLTEPSHGSIKVNGKRPQDARIGFVPQDFRESLLPWRTVTGNIELGLEIQGRDRSERRRVSKNALKEVGLMEAGNRYPYQLSGGMAQLTAIARALAIEPDVVVMDEPLNALDYYTRISMLKRISDIWSRRRITTLLVSHNIDEAIFLSDRIFIFSQKPGRIKKEVRPDIPRPRTTEVMFGKAMTGTRKELMKEFAGGML